MKKAVAALVYLLSNGREIEMEYRGKALFASSDNSRDNYSLWVEETEQSFG